MLRSHHKDIPFSKVIIDSKTFRRKKTHSITKKVDMIKNIVFFLAMGLVWLFIFSIPVGHQGKHVFNVGYYYLVDTKLVHKITDFASNTFFKTGSTASNVLDDVVEKVENTKTP
jgi:hypothetical protein